MVLRRMHSKVHELRQRPREEREAIASLIAVAVVVVLLIGWVLFFVRGIFLSVPHMPVAPVTDTGAVQIQQTQAQTTSDASSPRVSDVLVQTASTTQPMGDASAEATVKALMQIANGQNAQ